VPFVFFVFKTSRRLADKAGFLDSRVGRGGLQKRQLNTKGTKGMKIYDFPFDLT
jgi:hypothetical protein